MPAKSSKSRPAVETDSDGSPTRPVCLIATVEQVPAQPAPKRPAKRKSPAAAADAGPSKRKAVAPSDTIARLKTENEKAR